MRMEKKMMFLFLLFLLIFGTADLYAQVTIGSDEAPHSGAILDLQSTEKGLKLPTVSLTDVAEFGLSGDANGAEGMMVYNTNDYTINGNGKGIYTWSGKWFFAGKNAPVDVPVSRIVITSEGNVNMVRAGVPLQLRDSVLPADASNKKVKWSVPWSSSLSAGKATVDDTGLVTTIKPGSVTVQASAIDGSGASLGFTLTVLPNGTAENISASSENGQYSVEVGKQLQLIAEITPESASQIVSWEVISGKDFCTVNTGGLVTVTGSGNIKIKCSHAESDLADTVAIESLEFSLPENGIKILKWKAKDDSEFACRTYAFGDTVWMIDPSRLGDATYKKYDTKDSTVYYYSYTQALSACPSGWHLPTLATAKHTANYLETNGNEEEINLWAKQSIFGYYFSGWSSWGIRTTIIILPGAHCHLSVPSDNIISYVSGGLYAPVRCVMAREEWDKLSSE
ncbi:MAG: Ig-like domain-containing protein [Dysgonamonadaceae bacterium]|jgi:hypothetical protein|nr:Ig-like domain-containing protein [Dysgonamonadaceae bacterium]